jgi:hypothetical protein
MTKLLLVCGPWGSGTTAVAGVLRGMGAVGFGPYHKTTDSRTPNSFELVPFRSTVLSLIREVPLSFRDGAAERAADALQQFHTRMEDREFGPYDSERDRILLKCPASAPLISQICHTFDTRLIYVVRPFGEIERSQRRRRWPAYYGRAGARAIYDCMFNVLVEESYPTMMVQYADLLAAPGKVARGLASFGDLIVDSERISVAANFVRQPVDGSTPA